MNKQVFHRKFRFFNEIYPALIRSSNNIHSFKWYKFPIYKLLLKDKAGIQNITYSTFIRE